MRSYKELPGSPHSANIHVWPLTPQKVWCVIRAKNGLECISQEGGFQTEGALLVGDFQREGGLNEGGF